MKKFITVSTAIALFGAALLFVGCTKDYSQDITDVKKDVEQLQSDVSTANKNIETLQSQVKTLEQAKTELETAVKNLESSKADKTTVESVQKALQSQIDAINKTLTSVQETLAKKADKSYVDQTFATIKALDEVAERVGALETTVSQLKTIVAGLGDDVKGVLERLTAVEGVASKAAEDIKNLGDELHNLYYQKGEVNGLIDAVRGDLSDSTAKVREELQIEVEAINTEIDELEQKLDEEIQRSIEQDSTLAVLIQKETETREALAEKHKADSLKMEQYREEIWQYIDEEGGIIPRALEEIRADITTLQNRIENFKNEYDAFVVAVGLKFYAISERVTSISVCPTLTPEYVTIVTGNPQLTSNYQRMLVADFAIEPASKVDKIVAAYKAKKDSLTLGYTWAISRAKSQTKSEVTYNKATITSVYEVENNNGKHSLRVVATGIKEAEAQIQDKSLYYALEYQSKDSVGTYAVMSDFVEAIQAEDPVEMTSYFKFAKMNGQAIEFLELNSNDEYRDTTEYDYIAADTLKNCLTTYGGTKKQTDEKPFADKFVAVQTDFTGLMAKIFPEQAYTVKEYEALTGQKVELECDVNADTDNPVKNNFLPKNAFDVDVYFKPASPREMFSYVSDQSYPDRMSFDVNEVASPYWLIKDYMITKKKHPEVTLPDTYIYWNYKQYKNEDRKITLDASKDTLGYKADLWNEAISKNAEVTTYFTHKWLVYSFLQNGYQPLYIDINGTNYENDWGTVRKQEKQVIDTYCVKETYSDWYKFNLKTTIETPFVIDALYAEQQTLDGSVTLDREFTIKDIDTLYISPDKTQNVRERLISGLTGDDKNFASVKKAFDEQINACTIEVWRNGKEITSKFVSTDPTQVYNPATGDLTLTFKAGTITYDEKVEILIKVKDIFGRVYQIEQPINTNSPKYRLAYNDMYVKDTTATAKAEVRGKIGASNKVGRYTIEEMHYANYWKLVGDFSDEDKDAIFELCFDGNDYNPAPANQWGPIVGSTIGQIAFADVQFVDHKLPYKEIMTWNSETQIKANNNYKGTYFTMTPRLKVKSNDETIVADFKNYDSNVNKPVKFYTREPLKFSATSYVIEKTREAGKNLDFYYYAPVKVYGFYDDGQGGTWTTTNLYVNGEFGTDESKNQVYDGAEVKYIIPDEITTDDGKYLLKRGQDYQFSEDNQKLWILAESAIAEDYSFTIEAELHNALDHLSYDGVLNNEFKEEAVKTANVKISVKQN